ncbi:efflux RND transporter periplasmic adaptor subunit [Geomonas sp. RF6]|uniref:HlyD family secretion protein n=1 Tax=Geomonas sp. RF6 TaxID=2897342 RepID=UPI001E326AB3|nr:efflux RND transporter periplasmic adaptor subunit [Geomonas sp. RF6]UFS71006.1 efflux RND transporter periplasmic adaptor subunit [Geomonas sp. RF6]
MLHVNKRLVAVALLLTILAAAAWWYLVPKRVPRDVLKVSGNVELTAVQVSFKVPGRVKARLVDEGAVVRRGEVVALLDDEELRHGVEQAAGQEGAAAAALEELKNGARAEEIAEAEALVEQAQAQAQRLQADFKRQAALYQKEVISRRDFEAAQAAEIASRAALAERKQALKLLRKGARREQVDQGAARVQQARGVLSEAKARLSYATLLSPISGVVLSKGIEPGEQVAPGTPVITVGDLENTWLKAYIPETELGRVHLGQAARVTTDSYPGRVFEGRVTFISSEAEFTPKNVQTEKERVKLVYRIKISLPNPKMELKPGMPADAQIVTGG